MWSSCGTPSRPASCATASGSGPFASSRSAVLATLAGPRLLHEPIPAAFAGRELVVTADTTTPLAARRITVHVRGPDRAFRPIDMERGSDGAYAAIVPGREISPPSLEYFLTWEDAEGREHAAFASAALPHGVVVHGSPLEDAAAAELLRRGGRRSEIRSRAEWIDFGRGGGSMMHAEAGYQHALLQVVHELGVGAGVLRGDDPRPGPEAASDLRAYHYGYGDLGFRPAGDVGLGARILLGANHRSFGAGLEGRITIGRRGGTEGEIAAGAIQELGWWSRFGLQWDTVPGVLLRAGVELTTLPVDGDPAVRLLTGAAIPVTRWLELEARGGYQARAAGVGGPAAGGGAVFSF